LLLIIKSNHTTLSNEACNLELEDSYKFIHELTWLLIGCNALAELSTFLSSTLGRRIFSHAFIFLGSK